MDTQLPRQPIRQMMLTDAGRCTKSIVLWRARHRGDQHSAAENIRLPFLSHIDIEKTSPVRKKTCVSFFPPPYPSLRWWFPSCSSFFWLLPLAPGNWRMCSAGSFSMSNTLPRRSASSSGRETKRTASICLARGPQRPICTRTMKLPSGSMTSMSPLSTASMVALVTAVWLFVTRSKRTSKTLARSQSTSTGRTILKILPRGLT